MKELTIEQKALAYDNALKVIKGCNPDENGFITIYPQEMFPELKVSDDERMRNGLIKLLNCIAASEYENTIGITKEEALEWVKRQGEDKSIPCSDGTVDNSLEGIINAAIYWGKGAPTENGRIPEDKVKGAVDYYCSLLRNNDAWSEEDEKMFNNIAVHLSATCNGFPEDEKWANKFLDWLKSLKDRVQPQSKQEWSEDDVKMLDFAIRAVGLCKQYAINHQVDGYSKLPDVPKRYEELQNWLKSLKDRVQPQPKHEWSVKDLTRFNDVIRIIEGSDNVASIKKHYVDFLKSIMQRSITQSTWKPSDEQIEAMNYYIKNDIDNDGVFGSQLVKLYQDLLKLKG